MQHESAYVLVFVLSLKHAPPLTPPLTPTVLCCVPIELTSLSLVVTSKGILWGKLVMVFYVRKQFLFTLAC